ncbi:phosphate ABC transporter permease PstA [Georgenia alba]|uniref:Phosphate transport system permease protein PstA n=1 Tax=Georgenia alba TaxID=2233858 RepID=A0ABW2QCV3_9MICO
MTTTTTTPKRRPLAQVKRLPKHTPWALLAAALAVAFLVLQLLSTPTPAGVFFLAAALYVLATWVLSRVVEGPRQATDRLATAVVTGAFVLVMIPLGSLVTQVAAEGMKFMSFDFLNTDMGGVFGEIRDGGAGHAIVGTLYVTGLASAFAIPLGILTAVYLVEFGRGRLARAITLLVDVMTGIPSIVAGLFVFVLFAQIDPQYRSAFMGGVALAVLMTPVVVRSVEEMLKLVPNELREASYALGVPKWLTVVKVVLRTAIAGITTGVMIAIARVIGETAPLLLTVGSSAVLFNYSPVEGRIMTLPVYVYSQYRQGAGIQGSVEVERAWAAALTLIVIVMLLNLVARLVSKFFSPKGIS